VVAFAIFGVVVFGYFILPLLDVPFRDTRRRNPTDIA
jgi:hypothetical protein